jgi:hypothetical protein
MKNIGYLTLLLVLSALLFGNKGYCQISKGGKPYSFAKTELNDSVLIVKMPKVNADSLVAVDAMEKDVNRPFRFGYAMNVDMGLRNSGTWDTLTDGSKIWRLKIHSKDAYSINLIFDEFWLPQGAYFFVYNEEKSMVLGAFTAEVSNNEYNKFATDLVKGSTLVLEYYEPAFINGGIINIGKVIHAYVNTFSNGVGTSGNCNIDVNCAQGNNWCVEKRATSLILVDDNTSWCSGCLVNNVKQDLTPYYLTANHCLRGDENTWIYRFKYWRPNCSGSDPYSWVSIVGSTLKAKWDDTDFALLELSAQPPSGFGVLYAGWDRTSYSPLSGVGIHHPRGDVMKISTYTAAPQAYLARKCCTCLYYMSTWRLQFSQGVTEPGSSGSPLFNQNNRIVGQLFGTTCENRISCNNQSGDAIYGRFDVSWTGGGTSSTRLSNWLDPDNTGVATIGATSPRIYLINRTLTGPDNFAALQDLHIEGNVTTNGLLCQPSNIPFTTEFGSNLSFVAKTITIYSGTEIKLGSNVVIEAKNNIDCLDNIVEGDYVNDFCDAQISMLNPDDISMEQRHSMSLLENDEDSDEIIVYPNPNNGKLVVEFSKTIKSNQNYLKSIIVTDVSGRIVYNKNNIDKKKEYVDISGSPKGVYFIRIKSENLDITKKILIQ